MSGKHYTEIERRQQDVQIMDLHLAGNSPRSIAETTGLGHATVSRRIASLVDQFAPDAERYRKTVTMRLERILHRLDRGLNSDDPAVVANSAGKALAALDSLRRLYGMDSAQQLEVIHLDPQDIELRRMIQEVESLGKAATQTSHVPAPHSSTPQEKA
jgi:hypothetical protein